MLFGRMSNVRRPNAIDFAIKIFGSNLHVNVARIAASYWVTPRKEDLSQCITSELCQIYTFMLLVYRQLL